ncbi:amidohydrolase family protein [Cryptosporangium phraense]|uniref:amidohydrolase family protein n=1 Tax=Cryptosporangium phraense TaxID=2593070 RepID=UPI00197ADBDA|nr:amidohydrolase family protein [Cryptosporangium phraense]
MSTYPLVDHHCHGVVTRDLDRAGLEALLSEGGAPADGESNFDTPLGLAIRRHCAPLLDLPVHAPVAEYLERRASLGAEEVARRFLGATGTARYLVDTGFNASGLTSPAELAVLGGGSASEIVRLESVAEAVAAAGVEPSEFGDVFRSSLARVVAEVGAVGVKSVAAYRTGFRLDPSPPSPAEVSAAAARWLWSRGAGDGGAAGAGGADGGGAGGAGGGGGGGGEAVGGGGGGWRLAEPVLQRMTLEAAIELGLPIQFHVGFGDSDIRMTEVDPTLLSDWIRRHRVPVMLLHCWPFQRQASFLAHVFPNVYVDVGLALHYVGPRRGVEVLAEVAEVTPFSRLLYSSDAYGAPELYALGAHGFRVALEALLTDRVESGEWSASDADRIGHLIAHGNAERVYRL